MQIFKFEKIIFPKHDSTIYNIIFLEFLVFEKKIELCVLIFFKKEK